MAVDAVVFPIDISQDASGGPSFHTTIVTAGSGFETRNADQTAARQKWDIGHFIQDQSTLDTLNAFFRARQGQARGFLFLDYSDFYAGMTWSGDNIVYSGTPVLVGVGDGVTTVFQLVKLYADSVNPVSRKITRPMTGTCSIYLGAGYTLQSTGFTINYTTGQVTFAVAPAATVQIWWSGQFYTPARFATDDMRIVLHHVQLGDWQSVPLVEVLE